MVIADYALTDADFTVLADSKNILEKVMNINLTTPNASLNGRIYIIKPVNLLNSFSTNGANIGFVNGNNLTLNNT
jgi:phospholipase/lecithinase/hemolysin